MGVSSSKRISETLQKSHDFNTACNSVYQHCLSLTQHSFPGVLPYQLFSASYLLHRSLSSLPLIQKWAPNPPTRTQVDKALKSLTSDPGQAQIVLGPAQFRDFALELYTDVVVFNAGKWVLWRVPVGVVGIVGVGGLTRSGKGLVGTASGIYALGVATWVYLGLGG